MEAAPRRRLNQVTQVGKRELLRYVLVDEYICHTCVMEDAKKILDHDEQDRKNRERRDPKWDVLSEVFVPDEELTEDGKIGITYRGPFRPLESRVQMQDLARGPYCIHMRKTQAPIHPLTAKVCVAAKLSAGDDDDERLTREAEKYQAFPHHFFDIGVGATLSRLENIQPQLHRWYPTGTTSLTAPRTPSTSAPSSFKNTVEGRAIRLCSRLTTNMFPIRHHHPGVDLDHFRTLVMIKKASWIYSVDGFQGHVLRQPGPLSDWPGMGRMVNVSARDRWGKDWSYRLIDFADSIEVQNTEDGREVERSMEKML